MVKKKCSVRTDLCSDALSLKKLDNRSKCLIEGDIKISEIIIDKNLSKRIKRKEGLYFELDISECDILDSDDVKKIEICLSNVIKKILDYENIDVNQSRCLVLGLGNSNVSPDSLGPKVIDNVIVTRHMFLLDPSNVSEGINNVCAISPGVMGSTGIETYDIVKAVVDAVDVDFMIVVDALASLDISKINNCIQLTNTGIHPGSGVGNKRKELSLETLGKKVIAIGIPTVVDALTITINTIDRFIERINIDEDLKVISNKDKDIFINDLLKEEGFNMFVTPKEVDIDLKNLSEIVSAAIDRALHPIIEGI